MQQTSAIAQTLIELLKKQQFLQAYNELFSDDAESIDPLNPQKGPVKGLDKLIALETKFLSSSTIHHIEISEAILSGDYFGIQLAMTFSIGGQKKRIDELCVYRVKAGKIISQQFFIS
jgi:hypothetical protein